MPAPKKYPYDCPTGYCNGYGLYHYTHTKIAMSKKGAEEIGYRTRACPKCGANRNPNGKV